jgi:hypothetical protein
MNPVTKVTLQLGTIDEAKAQILTMPEEKLRALQKQMGLKPTGFADPTTVDAVDSFLGYVSDINANGVQKTWQQVLDKLTDGGKTTLSDAVSGSSSSASKPFTGSKTTTSSDVRLLSASEVRGMAEQAFVAAVGREPTRQERISLRQSLNDMSRDNPTVTHKTTDYEDGVATGSHSVTNGGVNFDQKVLNEARSQEGYGEYQAVANYFPAMMEALSAPGGA